MYNHNISLNKWIDEFVKLIKSLLINIFQEYLAMLDVVNYYCS